jgi:hypothetical protein
MQSVGQSPDSDLREGQLVKTNSSCNSPRRIKNVKKTIALLVPVLCLATLSLSAKADTLELKGYNSSIGPYQLSLNGSSTNLNLFCLDDFRQIQIGESWGVTIVNGANYLNSNKHSSDFKYEEEAYIYSELGKSNGHGHTYTTTDVQQALWNVFDNNADTNSYAEALLSAAHSFTYSTGFLDDFNFYIPTGSNIHNGVWGNLPQEMIGTAPSVATAPAPEPSSLLLFGSGLVGLAGAVRRKLSRV